MPGRLRPLFLSLLLVSSAAAGAQELPFTHFTPNDQVSPLPSASVQKIAQDHLGYIWMGFYSTGLTRYDGHAMESYSDQDGLADLTVREIVEDRWHHLWVGSEAGLVLSEKPLDDGRVRFVDHIGLDALIHARIRRNCLAADHSGWVWVGAQDGFLRYRIERGKLRMQRVDKRSVECIATRRDGTVVVGFSDNGIGTFRANGTKLSELATPVTITALRETSDGTLWAGTVDGAVARVIGGQ